MTVVPPECCPPFAVGLGWADSRECAVPPEHSLETRLVPLGLRL